MKEIVVATQNKHKIDEINEITKKFGFKTFSLEDVGLSDIEIVEDGATFEENSFIKASTIKKQIDKIVIADDSGLEVDALDARPGVFSARFAGEDATDGENNEKLQKELLGIPYKKRTARFVCVITMLFTDGKKIVARGEVEGHIIDESRGENGFGYDPYFVPNGYDKTFGELTSDIKNKISHRAKALEQLAKKLKAE